MGRVLSSGIPAWSRKPRDNNALPDDIKSETRSLDAKIDINHLRRNRIFVQGKDEESKIAISAFKSLRTHMLREMATRPQNSLTVTGTTQGVGKSVIAANLAINIARHKEKHVLLVDLDLRAPSVASLFGLRPTFGVDSPETYEGPNPNLQQSIVYPDIERLSILPCVRAHENSTELLLSKEMRSLLKHLQQPNDDYVVIFDAPPVLGCDDIAALTSVTDLYLVVVGEGQTSRRELRTAMTVLGDTPIAGVVLNKTIQPFFKRYYY